MLDAQLGVVALVEARLGELRRRPGVIARLQRAPPRGPQHLAEGHLEIGHAGVERQRPGEPGDGRGLLPEPPLGEAEAPQQRGVVR